MTEIFLHLPQYKLSSPISQLWHKVIAKRNQRVLVRVCVCVEGGVYLCVCVCTITQEVVYLGTSNLNTLLHMKISQTSSISGIVGPRSRSLHFSPFTTIQTVRSHNSTLVQARKLILSIYVHLILTYKSYEYCHV